jgi:hypothetical protein
MIHAGVKTPATSFARYRGHELLVPAKVFFEVPRPKHLRRVRVVAPVRRLAFAECLFFQVWALIRALLLFERGKEIAQHIDVAAVVAVTHEVEVDVRTIDRLDTRDDERRVGIAGALFAMQPLGRGERCVTAAGVECDAVGVGEDAREPALKIAQPHIGGAERDVRELLALV